MDSVYAAAYPLLHAWSREKGIDPEIADRIFLPHFSTKKSGSGLGLAISRQAIHQMNGTIEFHTRVNVGTTFTIELPEAVGLTTDDLNAPRDA